MREELLFSKCMMRVARHFELPEFMCESHLEERQAAKGPYWARQMWDTFQFPFDVVAVSDRHPNNQTIIIVGRLGITGVNGHVETTTGLNQALKVAVLTELSSEVADYYAVMSTAYMQKVDPEELAVLVSPPQSLLMTKGAKVVSSVAKKLQPNDRDTYEHGRREFIGQTLKEAVELMAIIQSPKRFIVEMSPIVRQRVIRKGKKKSCELRPLSNRPLYIGMTSQECRKTFGMPSGRKVADHDVRAHYRTLRSERFTKKRGQRVFVKAHFSAPQEGRMPDGRRYKVRLDIVSPWSRSDTFSGSSERVLASEAQAGT